MDDNAAPGNQSEYTECMSNTFADNDPVCSTVVTRAAQQVIDLTVNRACSVNDNQLAQNSPKRQRISDDAMIMKPSMKAPPDAAILELKTEYKARFGRLPRGRFASTSSWLTSAIADKNRLTSTFYLITDYLVILIVKMRQLSQYDLVHLTTKILKRLSCGSLRTGRLARQWKIRMLQCYLTPCITVTDN
jgi:hypothetical protein